MPDNWRSEQAATARRWGAEFENEVRNACKLYRARGEAKILYSLPSARYSADASGIGVAPVDFSGRLRDGRKIAFDCKNVTRTALFTYEKNRYHQLYHLDRVRAHGGLAFVLVHDKDFELTYVVTDVPALLAGKSIPLREAGTRVATEAPVPLQPTAELHGGEGEPWWWDFLPVAIQHCCAK